MWDGLTGNPINIEQMAADAWGLLVNLGGPILLSLGGIVLFAAILFTLIASFKFFISR